jgi:diacylglycerol kinase family enzyme
LIGIITNANAQSLIRDKDLAQRLQGIVGQDGLVYETHTLDELASAVRELHARKVDVLATCGGDGTNLSTLTEMVRTWTPANDTTPALPNFAILRGGTVNTVAGNVGLRGRPEEILERLVSRYRERKPLRSVPLDSVSVNGMFGFLFGTGMPGRFFDAYYAGPTPGVGWAAVLAARTIASGLYGGKFSSWLFEALPAEVEVDGRKLDADRFTLIVAATVRNVGLGVKIAYRAGERPGHFHFLASSLPASRLVSQPDRVFRGLPLRGQPHEDTLARTARIRFREPQTYTLDGDLFRADTVELACGPRLSILTP